MKRIYTITGCILFIIASTYISFWVGDIIGVFAWFCVLVLIAIEVIYQLGAKGSRLRSFKSKNASEVPDVRIEQSIQSARGWYDLDYRGRGKN